MNDEQLVAPIGQWVGDDVGEAELPRRLAQHDEAAVGVEIAGVMRGCERLAVER